ncbi:hypothetical protein H072_4448 [Dactylellina haptotyla CBS 200.50]|uniref:Uncharacterized protein n=1 Tax=Dactylellina haptotyla (strain CBS 200.50) TaxID=1284197 RepID=S8BQC4_DACHA|nr:hypothetical protein H072_4448 [Dactylellina haptotyla CBS 200.50]
MATASSPSPHPVFTSPSPLASFITSSSPSPSQHSTTSPTPPPRPPSSPGISVFAPRPMRIPMYRPQFSRPVFLYDTETTGEKENAQPGHSPYHSATRRSSVASAGIPEESLDSKIIYNPSKDVLEELFKIVRPTSASSASTSSTAPPAVTSSPSASFIRPQPLHPRSPNASHRRNTSDASDGGLSSILGGLSVLTSANQRTSPDASANEWRNMRTAVSPVARRAIGNPMIRDPSFQGETPKKDS